jgi:uncharacterized repeat protein (TIGR01451 family)
MTHKLSPRYISLICAAVTSLVGVLALLWVMGNSGPVAHAATISYQQSAVPQGGFALSSQPSTVARRPPADLPPGASVEWWATVQEQLHREVPLSSLSITASWTAGGESDGNWFGHSVATAGDVNGDGYADVVVGAYGYDNFNRRGKVYVYRGSATGLETTPAFTATGENDLDEFGASVASAGDVNGDGYADIVVGARSYAGNTGKMYVYYGSASGLHATDVFSIAGENPNDYFGCSVAMAGDANDDGYADVVVGAYGHSSNTGKIYVYRGSADGLVATPTFTAAGESASDSFGFSVAPAGDANGDGYADLVVGAFFNSSGRGKIYVYRGSTAGLTSTGIFTAAGEANYSYFGYSVATAGDVNGDGYSDVVVGADNYAGNVGRAYVYRGSAAGLVAAPIFTATGETGSANFFGASVGTAGDVNGDGYADVVVGAYAYPNGTYQGKAYVYYGSANGLSTTVAFSATGEPSAERFGVSVATAGDVNGDGYADIIVGADGEGGSLQQGKAYVYHGAADSPGATPVFKAFVPLNANWTPYDTPIATAGDVNGDGYADIVVGASAYPNGEAKGRIDIYHGPATGMSGTPAFTAIGEANGDNFGHSVATAGDVNGDGYADVIVGAPYSGNGKIYVYYGSATGLVAPAAFTATGEADGDYFGFSVASAGDVNGDGYADIIVGAEQYDNNKGKMYVYYGSAAGLSAAPAFSATGETWNNFLGHSVATAGDVNGDGYADIVVGAFGYAYDSRGKIYVYHGSAEGLVATPTLTLISETGIDGFGASVASAGDVNGDGYADVVVGAPLYPQANYEEKGKIYVYYGSAAGLSATPAFTAIGEANFDNFGHSVATAGDVNGDGYADVIVGANGYSNLKGKTYVYQGSASGLAATPIFTATGEIDNGYGGYCVATAGDWNGDGYADVVAWHYWGLAYVYQGNGGAGLTLRPRQMRSDGTVHIAPLGKSDSASTVQLRLTGHMPLGREKVKLEWQVAPLGTPFTSTSVISGTSAGWTDTLTAGAVITQNVTGLTPGTPYHWRVRLRYRPGNLLGQNASRWLTIPWNGWTEQDFRTSQNEVNLAIAKAAASAAAAPGVPITYTLLFSNTGNITASGVLITDVIPVSVSNTSVASSGVTITRTPGITYAWQVANLAPGQGGVITLTGVLSSPLAAGTFANTATIAGTMAEVVTTNNSSAAEITVLNVAPVAVDDTYGTTKDTPLTIATPGVLSNDSDLNGDGLTAMLAGDVLTGTLSFNLGGGFVYTPALNYDGAVTFTYRATDGLELSNLALVTISVLPAPEADLSISKSSLRAGMSITYTIAVTNSGPAAANGAAVFDPVPPGIASFAWSCAAAGGAACGNANGSGGISQTVSLPAGGAVTYTVTGTLVVSSATVVNTATIAVPLGVVDPSPGDNQAVNFSGSQLYLPIILKNP